MLVFVGPICDVRVTAKCLRIGIPVVNSRLKAYGLVSLILADRDSLLLGASWGRVDHFNKGNNAAVGGLTAALWAAKWT